MTAPTIRNLFGKNNKKIMFLSRFTLMVCCLMLLLLAPAWSVSNLAQAVTEEPTLKQVIEEDTP